MNHRKICRIPDISIIIPIFARKQQMLDHNCGDIQIRDFIVHWNLYYKPLGQHVFVHSSQMHNPMQSVILRLCVQQPNIFVNTVCETVFNNRIKLYSCPSVTRNLMYFYEYLRQPSTLLTKTRDSSGSIQWLPLCIFVKIDSLSGSYLH